jgi:hypothetical protein
MNPHIPPTTHQSVTGAYPLAIWMLSLTVLAATAVAACN